MCLGSRLLQSSALRARLLQSSVLTLSSMAAATQHTSKSTPEEQCAEARPAHPRIAYLLKAFYKAREFEPLKMVYPQGPASLRQHRRYLLAAGFLGGHYKARGTIGVCFARRAAKEKGASVRAGLAIMKPWFRCHTTYPERKERFASFVSPGVD